MYAFSINANGTALAELKRLDAALATTDSQTKMHVGQIEGEFSGMQEKVGGIFSNLKSIIAGSLIGGGIFAGFDFIKDAKETYEALEKSITRVNTVLSSTNFAAGQSSNAIQDQAKQLSHGIVASRAEILDAQGMLLSFTGIKGPVFGETTKAVADFATFYKEDMTSAALQIGKALNNPAQGMNRLQRQGVAFTDQQKEAIKNYQKQGDLLDAQRVILKELHTEFGGQAFAFAKTDEGRVKMDAKEWDDLKLEIGEIISKVQLSLLPVFAQVRLYVKEAFESGPIQFLLEHIKDLLSIGLKIIPMWVIYKGILLSTSLVTSGFAAVQSLLTTAIAETTAVTGEATVAASGFSAAFSATGIGAIAVALGLVVDHLLDMNAQLDAAIDKKYNLSSDNSYYNEQADRFKSIQERASVLNDPNFTKTEKQQLLGDAQNYLHDARLKFKALQTDAGNMLRDSKINPNGTIGDKIIAMAGMGGMDFSALASKEFQNKFKLSADAMTALKNLNSFGYNFGRTKDIVGTLTGLGIKIPKGYNNAGGGGKNIAYATSALAGAKGGLGEAKEIHIHIDTMQKIEGFVPSDIKNHASEAIQILIRAINNLSGSQGSTM